MGVPAAAGYPSYSGNLITPQFSEDLLNLFYCITIYPKIATARYTQQLKRCGDQITFWRAPEAKTYPYEKGGKIIRDTIQSEPVTLVVNTARQFGLRLDDIDEQQICNAEMIIEEYKRRAAYQLATDIDTALLGTMYADADVNNSGVNAGVKTHSINLGVPGAPVPLSANNIIQYLNNINQVMVEQCAPTANKFIVLPPIGETVLMNSELKVVNVSGIDTSPILNGKIPGKVAGFDVYISNFLPMVFDPGVGANCFQIVAGYPDATGFVATIDKTRVIPDPDSFGHFYDGLGVYGFKVLYPKGIVSLYARFN